MKTPPDPNDPLLQSLAEEAADLPLRAASEARKTRARAMQQRRQFALTLTVLFCGVCAWQAFTPNDSRRENVAVQSSPSNPSSPSSPLSPPENPDAPLSKPDPNDAPKLALDHKPSAPMPSPTHASWLEPDLKRLAPAPNHNFSKAATPAPSEYVKVQTEEQARNSPLPLPDGLSREQQRVVEAARGLPLLLVRDSAGKVTRIHVIER